jgi:hypothetical protein
MAEHTFETFIANERERLHNERAALYDQQKELEDKLAVINRELVAITAYEAAKQGKALPSPEAAAKERRPRTQGDASAKRSRGEGSGLRQQVLDLIRKAGHGGITSSDIVVSLQMDEKAGRQAVANALMALKRDGEIQQAGRRQPYIATEHPEEDQQAA